MAEYQITYWRDLPSMVTAREGRRNTAKVELPQRFQDAIDRAAMLMNLTGSDAYMEQWRREGWQEREGTPETIAQTVATELEETYPPARLREMVHALSKAKE
jgi:Virulence factor